MGACGGCGVGGGGIYSRCDVFWGGSRDGEGVHSELAGAAGMGGGGLAAAAWALRVLGREGGGTVSPAWVAALTWERTVRRVCPRSVTGIGQHRMGRGLYRDGGLQSHPSKGLPSPAEPGGMRVLLLRGNRIPPRLR